MTTNAQEYYKKVMSSENPYGYLEFLPLVPEVETEWLEFKGADKIADADALKYWSKALSGFANTSGGVLIWGIDARRDKQSGVDCANSLALVPDPDRFAQRLSDVLLNSVTPPVRGVEIRAIKGSKGRPGFVVCLVPEGSMKPHRAEGSGMQFFMRMRDSFDIPPVAVLRSMFYPASSAQLVPSVWIAPSNPPYKVLLEFSLNNVGNITAEQIFTIVRHDVNVPFMVQAAPGAAIQHTLPESGHIPFEVVRYLHPRMNSVTFARYVIDGTHNFPVQTKLEVEVCCKNTAPTLWRCDICHPAFFVKQLIALTPLEST